MSYKTYIWQSDLKFIFTQRIVSFSWSFGQLDPGHWAGEEALHHDKAVPGQCGGRVDSGVQDELRCNQGCGLAKSIVLASVKIWCRNVQKVVGSFTCCWFAPKVTFGQRNGMVWKWMWIFQPLLDAMINEEKPFFLYPIFIYYITISLYKHV